MPRNVHVCVCDMHAEATSEKVAMGHWLDGRCSHDRRHPHPHPHRRRPHPPRRQRLHQRPGHVRALRFRAGPPQGSRPETHDHQHAAPLRRSPPATCACAARWPRSTRKPAGPCQSSESKFAGKMRIRRMMRMINQGRGIRGSELSPFRHFPGSYRFNAWLQRSTKGQLSPLSKARTSPAMDRT